MTREVVYHTKDPRDKRLLVERALLSSGEPHWLFDSSAQFNLLFEAAYQLGVSSVSLKLNTSVPQYHCMSAHTRYMHSLMLLWKLHKASEKEGEVYGIGATHAHLGLIGPFWNELNEVWKERQR